MTTTMRLPAEHVAQLVDLLTVVATAADTDDEDRYQLHYCRSQLGELMPPIVSLAVITSSCTSMSIDDAQLANHSWLRARTSAMSVWAMGGANTSKRTTSSA